MKVMLTAIALSAVVTFGASAQGINLSGPWQCVAACAGPPGGFAYITQYSWDLNPRRSVRASRECLSLNSRRTCDGRPCDRPAVVDL